MWRPTSQETLSLEDRLQSSSKLVQQLVPLVGIALAYVMLNNALFVQPLKDAVKDAQAQTKEQLQASQAQMQASQTQFQAQTQAQLTRIESLLSEVPRLAGKVEILEILQENSRSMNKR